MPDCSGFAITIDGNAPLTCTDGAITLTATGGASYLWSNGATTESIVVSGAGSYSVTGTGAQ